MTRVPGAAAAPPTRLRAAVRIVLIAALTGVTVWAGARWLFPDDATEIRAALERLIAVTQGAEDDDDIGRLARASAVRRELTLDATANPGPPIPPLTGRDAIVGLAARLVGTVPNLEMTLPDVAIVVAPDRRRAAVQVTLETRFLDHAGEWRHDTRQLDLVFTRVDRQWLLRTITRGQAPHPLDHR